MQHNFESIIESNQVNICHIWYRVNNTPVKIFKHGLVDSFQIKDPSSFKITVNEHEYAYLTDMLIKGNCQFASEFYPKGYGKNQKENLYSIKIDLGYTNNPPFVKVEDFGYSYGKIIIDDKFEVDITHSGGTNDKGGWDDWAQAWNLIGPNAGKAFNYLIELLSNKK